MVVVDINEADFTNLAEFATIALLGKRRTGKTTWAKWLLQFIDGQCHRFCVCCGNKDNMAEWKQVVPPLYVNEKSIEYLKGVRNYQDKKCSYYTNNQQPVPIKYRITIVLDDCGSDRQFMHSDIIRDLLSNGRHYGMYLIILVQYLNQMHPVNRDQLDYVGILHTSNAKNIDKLYNEYCNACDRRVFAAVLKALTSNRGMCWIDNTASSVLLSDCIFYKELHTTQGALPVGSAKARMYSDQRYCSSDKQLALQQLEHAHRLSNSNPAVTLSTHTDGEDLDVEASVLTKSFVEYKQSVIPDSKGGVTVRLTKRTEDPNSEQTDD